MSFKCQMCGNAQSAGTSPARVVVETRKKIYPERYMGTPPNVRKVDNGGQGTEIVRELNVCPTCAPEPTPDYHTDAGENAAMYEDPPLNTLM